LVSDLSLCITKYNDLQLYATVYLFFFIQPPFFGKDSFIHLFSKPQFLFEELWEQHPYDASKTTRISTTSHRSAWKRLFVKCLAIKISCKLGTYDNRLSAIVLSHYFTGKDMIF